MGKRVKCSRPPSESGGDDDSEWETPMGSLEEVFAEEEEGAAAVPAEDADEDAPEEEHQDGTPEGQARSKTAEELERDRLSRKEQKALLQARKAAKPNAPLLVQAKKLWEVLRARASTRHEREEAMKQLMRMITGKVKEVIFKHDASRIIQCALKYGSPAQRDSIAKELAGEYANVARAHYGCFIISKILHYCSADVRTAVIQDFYGKVRKLIRHKEAALILGECYGNFANAAQKSALLAEFYGPEYALFKMEGAKSLADMLAEKPEKRDSILRHLRESLCSVLEKGTVAIGSISILHKALLDYFTHADEKSLPSMIELVKDHLVAILHTREGAQVAQRVLALATPKDRKHILKSLKGFVPKIAMEQYGHAVLLAIFEAVDDSVLVQKAVVSELCKEVPALTHNVYGLRVLLFLLTGRHKRHQPAFIVEELQALDSIRARTCKKEDAAKRAQLTALFLAEGAAACLEHVQELMRHKAGARLLLEVAKAPGTEAAWLRALADTVRAPAAQGGEGEEFHAIKKLSAEQATLDRLGRGIDLSQHPLVNRSATFLFKDIITAQAEAGTITSGAEEHFATLLARAMLPGLPGWLVQLTSQPTTMSGLVHVLMACLQSCAPPLQEELRNAVPTSTIQRALEEEEGPSVVDAELQAMRAQAKGSKRKRPVPAAAAGATATAEATLKPRPLEQLLALLAA